MVLVVDNGSQEDPITEPPVDLARFPECHEPGGGPNSRDGCYPQAEATGVALADAVAAELPRMQDLRSGAVAFERKQFFVPLENNAFKAAAAAGLFGKRPTYTAGVESGRTGPDLRTSVSVMRIGPDLQLIANPGESFPALMMGSRWGIDDAGCPDRANPPVPTWRGNAAYRFQVGLADDLIGYLLPAWAFSDRPPTYTTDCQNDATNRDPKKHKHKLETESVGPAAANAVAEQLSTLLAKTPDPVAQIRLGRFVHADGVLDRNPAGAVGVWVADADATSIGTGGGTLVALPGVTGFGSRALDSSGRMMDFDGAAQPGGPDIATRGMLVFGCDGSVARRIYVDVYPRLATGPLGPATRGNVQTGCGAGPAEAGREGNGPGGSAADGAVAAAGCTDARAPRSRFRRHGVTVSKRGRLSARGTSRDRGCAGLSAVLVSVSKPRGERCRFVQANGRLTKGRSCRRPALLRARGTRSWRLSLAHRLPRGRYRVQVRAIDRRGNKETPGRANVAPMRVR
jgi:hypothetical protein